MSYTMTKITKNNPWIGIIPSSKKRCISGPDIFWHVDENAIYCLRFENVELGAINFNNIELNEINIVLQDTGNGLFTITLKLLDPLKYELFYFLSSDLINHLANETPISAQKFKKRLQRWIDLWKKKNNREMTLIAQMNLFSELFVLFEFIASKKGIELAVLAWRGPEKDKQDFDLINYLVEVKSYLSTTKKVLKISSAEQLTVRKQPIKLVALQLSQNPSHGQSIFDLLSINSVILDQLSTETYGLFFSKLFELGYSDEKDAKNKFNVVSTTCYNVESDFPVISALSISDGIDSVEYSIKIDFISKHEINLKDLII
jgi:hypothetical protein